jgi:hypothetical protein
LRRGHAFSNQMRMTAARMWSRPRHWAAKAPWAGW